MMVVASSSICRLVMQLFAGGTTPFFQAIYRFGVDDLPRQLRRQRVLRLFVFAGTCLLAIFAGQACQKRDKPAAIALTLIDQGWVNKDTRDRLNEELRLFTTESGIRVEVLPAPESAVEQLATWRKLLEARAAVPDVYAVDVIWPAILADDLVDLKPYIPGPEIAAHFPELIANNTVNGKLVALPYNLDTGVLFYRIDLLQQYGYRAPPKNWEELESMAARIQAGERAKGNKDFWGFVWEGASSEALTCNALEWQVSEGGGKILENGMITVNNPQTIRAWERGARWVGSISPPGVVAYKEWDAFNIWQAGQAAFMRNWANAYVAARAPGSPIQKTFEVAPLPEGRAGLGATLGGHGYGVSRYSLHPQEAAMLVRFLCRRDVQLKRCRKTAQPSTLPDLYSDPEVLAANPYFSSILDTRNKIALRPAATSGKKYPDVSRAYFEAVHVVLTGKKSATQAASDLQIELQEITGLKAP